MDLLQGKGQPQSILVVLGELCVRVTPIVQTNTGSIRLWSQRTQWFYSQISVSKVLPVLTRTEPTSPKRA